MKIVVPNKLKEKVKEALTQLYLLKQTLTQVDAEKNKDKIIDKIDKIRALLNEET